MPSGTHTPAYPQRPGFASSRDSRARRERERERTADIADAVFVVAYDPRHAVVRPPGGGVEYVVDNPSGASFSPGSIVKVGSLAGHEYERFIIAGTPPTQGRSAPPVTKAIRLAGFTSPEPEEPPPPPPPTLYPIIGVYDDGADLHAWAYEADGSFREELSSIARPFTSGSPFVPLHSLQAALLPGPLLVFQDQAEYRWAAWDLVAGTVIVMTPPASTGAGDLDVAGIPLRYGDELRVLARYGPFSPDMVLLGSSLAASSTAAVLSSIAVPAFSWPGGRLYNGSTVWQVDASGFLNTFPLDGSTPTQSTPTIVNPSSIDAALQQTVPAGEGVAETYGIGRNNTTDRRQVQSTYNSATNTLTLGYNTGTGANFLGTFSSRAWSVGSSHDISAVYPWDANAGTGVQIKIMSPRGAPVDPFNSGFTPLITLAAVTGNTPQFAWIYDLTSADVL